MSTWLKKVKAKELFEQYWGLAYLALKGSLENPFPLKGFFM